MRTTVTLDPDVEELLREKVRASRKSFKQVLNNAVRQALRGEQISRAGGKFVVKARPLRLRAGTDPARVGEVADDLEIDAFLRISEELRRRGAS